MTRWRSLLPIMVGFVTVVVSFVLGVLLGLSAGRQAARKDERALSVAWHGYPTETHGDDFLKAIVAPTVRISAHFVGGIDGHARSMMGTGVLVSKDGLILTAWHITDPSHEVAVQLCSYLPNTVGDIRCAPEELRAVVVKHDEGSDASLLRLQKPLPNMPVAKLGDSDELAVGELMWRVGLDRVGLACGPVSSRPSGPHSFLDVLFPTPGGASGGPVYNSNKELMGIISKSPMDGLRGYAIPINRIRALFFHERRWPRGPETGAKP